MDIHKINLKQSNICVFTLIRILDFVTVKNGEIFLKDENLVIDGKKMLVYEKDSIKKRRKNKKVFEYFNPYKEEKHFEFIIHMIMEIEDIESLCNEKELLEIDFCNGEKTKVTHDEIDENDRTNILNALIKFLDV